MQVIARRTIREYCRQHAGARKWLQNWLKVAEKARWATLDDVRQVYRSADQYRHCLIFDKGNEFRLIVRVTYATKGRNGRLFIKRFLTHAEYAKDDWKERCQ